MKRLLNITVIALLCLYCCEKDEFPLSCNDDFGYNCWPKNGTIRRSIELPVNTFLEYELELQPGFNDSTIHFDLPLSEDDTVKIGRFDIDIYSNIENAQLALLNFLYAI
ncbi:hypothetical protein H8E88_16210 [candidate division KSB1 bacterium]|nr:hypothetical protein [candidate division KSB1 bacterium]